MGVRKAKLTMETPKVGDVIPRALTSVGYLSGTLRELTLCKVIFVNSAHNYYTVESIDNKIRESYNLPDFDHAILRGTQGWQRPVLCVETGYVYPSVRECSKDLDIDRTGISRVISGEYDTWHDYHFDVVV